MPTQLRSTLDNTRVFALWHIYIRAELMTGHVHDCIAIVYLQKLHCDHLRLHHQRTSMQENLTMPLRY